LNEYTVQATYQFHSNETFDNSPMIARHQQTNQTQRIYEATVQQTNHNREYTGTQAAALLTPNKKKKDLR
jgi:hypothetical protein